MRRARFWYVSLTALVVLVVAVRIATVHHGTSPDPAAGSGSVHALVAPSPMPSPTALNSNFLTQVNDCFLPTATVYGFNLYVSSGFRSFADQDALYAQGRTVNGHIVTNAPAGRSIHNYGLAIDVADHAYGLNIDWDKLEKIGDYCGLEHGDQGYLDLPHFEYRGELTTDQLESGIYTLKPLQLPCPLMATRAATGQTLTLDDLKTCNTPSFSNGRSTVFLQMQGLTSE